MSDARAAPIQLSSVVLADRLLIAATALAVGLVVCTGTELLYGAGGPGSGGHEHRPLRLSHLAEATGWISSYCLESSDQRADRPGGRPKCTTRGQLKMDQGRWPLSA